MSEMPKQSHMDECLKNGPSYKAHNLAFGRRMEAEELLARIRRADQEPPA